MSHRRDDPRARLSTSEAMTIPSVASTFLGGGRIGKNQPLPLGGVWLHKEDDQQEPLQPPPAPHGASPMAGAVCAVGQSFKERNDPGRTYAADSLPVAVCYNIPVSAAAGFTLKDATTTLRRGSRFAATSRANGATSTACGCTWWSAGRESRWSFPWPRGPSPTLRSSRSRSLTCPKARSSAPRRLTPIKTTGTFEEIGLRLKAQRKKKNSKRPIAAWEEFLGKLIRRYVETVFDRL